MDSVSPVELDHLLERGWRRFGQTYIFGQRAKHAM